jgi:hypothetical protein
LFHKGDAVSPNQAPPGNPSTTAVADGELTGEHMRSFPNTKRRTKPNLTSPPPQMLKEHTPSNARAGTKRRNKSFT